MLLRAPRFRRGFAAGWPSVLADGLLCTAASLGVGAGAPSRVGVAARCDVASAAGALSRSAAAEEAAAFRPREVVLVAVFAAFFVAFFAVVFVAFFEVPRPARLRGAGVSVSALSTEL
ncbi:MAG TPA: hypothetical protein VIR34_09240 [Gemmatimonadaceae bacterium]